MRKLRSNGVYLHDSGGGRRVISEQLLARRDGRKVATVTYSRGDRARTILRTSFLRWLRQADFHEGSR